MSHYPHVYTHSYAQVGTHVHTGRILYGGHLASGHVACALGASEGKTRPRIGPMPELESHGDVSSRFQPPVAVWHSGKCGGAPSLGGALAEGPKQHLLALESQKKSN